MLHVIRQIERRFGTGSAPGRLVAGVLLALVALLLFGIALLWSGAARAQQAHDPAAVATRLLDHMAAGRYGEAEAMFTPEMAQAVPAARLREVWESIPAQAGAAGARGDASMEPQRDLTLVAIPLHYEKAELVAKIAVTGAGRVSGFLVQPATQPAATAPVPEDASYGEREIAVGEGERALPATLAMPKTASAQAPVPSVVLVHGSGPHDRDESIGPNKPFLDIARGLAGRGIAVLRYDKRSKVRPQDFAGRAFTIDEETTDDAAAAVAALRGVEGVDPQRVFVFGHSQGGMLAPRIAHRAGGVAGLVLLAAPARPLLDILVEQNIRMAVLDDARTSDAERAAIEKLKAQVRAVRSGSADIQAEDLPLGLPAAYWRSTDVLDPVAEAQAAGLPMLVLQGARDIQVVDADWQRWKRGLHDDDKVMFKLYDDLNHLGIAGEGEGSLSEYMRPGHVDAGLIDDVAAWIGER